jgi:ribose 5-phosphate isomerase RpiB
VIGAELAKSIADAFLKETFDPEGRSSGNVAAINALDAKYNVR